MKTEPNAIKITPYPCGIRDLDAEGIQWPHVNFCQCTEETQKLRKDVDFLTEQVHKLTEVLCHYFEKGKKQE